MDAPEAEADAERSLSFVSRGRAALVSARTVLTELVPLVGLLEEEEDSSKVGGAGSLSSLEGGSAVSAAAFAAEVTRALKGSAGEGAGK